MTISHFAASLWNTIISSIHTWATRTQKGQLICPRLHRQSVAELRLKSGQPSSQQHLIVHSGLKNVSLLWHNSFFFSFIVVMGEGYIVAFTQVLTMYQLYPTWIHLLYILLPLCFQDSWRSFNRYHFCIYLTCIHIFRTIFTLLPPFPSITSHPR
jgi:hypothetical protein